MPHHNISIAIVGQMDPPCPSGTVSDHAEEVLRSHPASLDHVSSREVGEVALRIARMSMMAGIAKQPHKQIVKNLQSAITPVARLYYEEYQRKLKKRIARQRESECEERKKERAVLRAEPRHKIEEEARERLRILERAIKYRRGDKFLEQLKGRSEELTKFWIAMQLAILKKGSSPSDQLISDEFSMLSNENCSRHRARSRRKLVERLETYPSIWLRRKQLFSIDTSKERSYLKLPS